MSNIIRRVGCALGIHGPRFFGNEPRRRSICPGGFVRVCGDCGAVWQGGMVDVRLRVDGQWEDICTVGGWYRVKGKWDMTTWRLK